MFSSLLVTKFKQEFLKQLITHGNKQYAIITANDTKITENFIQFF